MKRKSIFLTLVLALAMVVTSISSVFAAAPPTDETRAAIDESLQSMTSLKDEVTAETFAVALANQVVEGKYKLMDTATLKTRLDAKLSNPQKNKMVIVDTMPEPWWADRHIPTAINQVVGGNGTANAPLYKISAQEKKDLLKKVNAAVGKKTVTKWYNKKTKKWTTVKPAKKYRGKSKKVKVVNKDVTVVTYCGFTKCQRSHQAAMYLKSQGFKNVFRYAGGITAWVQSDFDIEGKDVDKFIYMNDEEWAKYGIEVGDLRTSDYIIDVRGDKASGGFVPGAAKVAVTHKYTAEQQAALKEEYEKAAGKRIVIVCVSGNMLAKNAMDALRDAGVDMKNVTYLKGGFTKTWSQYLPTLSEDGTSLTVPAWVASDQINMNENPDQTHHILVNETGKNAPVALLNTKAIPAQVYKGLEALGASAGDGEGTTEGLNATDHPAGAFIKGTPINVTFEWKDGEETKTAGIPDWFSHIKEAGMNNDEANVEPYEAKMVFGGCNDTLNEESMGNPTGCITCTFSCWIGTVSNSAYAYLSGEALVNRAAVPAKGTPVNVVYTLGE